jgi:hypothetical protein
VSYVTSCFPGLKYKPEAELKDMYFGINIAGTLLTKVGPGLLPGGSGGK